MEAGGFPVAEGAQEDLSRPPAEERAPGVEARRAVSRVIC
jgi:hypothetical protein